MCSLANEGNAAGALKCETNRMRESLTQLTKAPESCSYSQTGSSVAEADRYVCHRRRVYRQVEHVPSISENNLVSSSLLL